MNMIRSKKDVEKLIDWIIANETVMGLWDEEDTIRSIIRIEQDDWMGYRVTYHEDITGEDWTQFHYPSELIDLIWKCRKHINYRRKQWKENITLPMAPI